LKVEVFHLNVSILIAIFILVFGSFSALRVVAAPETKISIEPRFVSGLYAPEKYVIVTESNCTIDPVPMKFNLTEHIVYFNISGNATDIGAINVTIPTNFMWGEFNATIDGVPANLTQVPITNETHIIIHLDVEFVDTTPVNVVISAENMITSPVAPPESENQGPSNETIVIHELILALGDSFTVNVTVTDAPPFSGWQVAIEYNLTFLECTGIWVPETDIFKMNGKSPIPMDYIIYDFKEYGFAATGAFILMDAVSGSGVLCSLNFTVRGAGDTQLRLATKEFPTYPPGAYQLPDGRWYPYAYWTYLYYWEDPDTELPYISESGTVATLGRKVPPVADFTITPTVTDHGDKMLIMPTQMNTSYFVDEPILFNASQSYDPDGNITKYMWDFGDGNFMETTSPIVYHAYNMTFLSVAITLQVVDDDNLTSPSVTKSIAIGKTLTLLDYRPVIWIFFGLIGVYIVFKIAKSSLRYAKNRSLTKQKP